ncbi:ATP synthase F1 subunit delta [Patescibacteria group bacterium]|nr:ATP synthase F1 subunit delta [Patescibacteria group bacterium]
MKIKPKQYAQTLFEITNEASKDQVDAAVEGFVGLVAKKGDLKQWPMIIEYFVKIYNKTNKIAEIRVNSKNKLTTSHLNSLEEKLKKLVIFEGYKDFKFIENTNHDLIGGVKIEFEDQVIDTSLKSRVEQLKIKMSQN